MQEDWTDKEFMFDIVANHRNGLDVDKWVVGLLCCMLGVARVRWPKDACVFSLGCLCLL